MHTTNIKTVDCSKEQAVMSRFKLDRIRILDNDADFFRKKVEEFTRLHTIEKWSNAWKHNRGDFLSTYAWDQDHDYGEGLVVKGAMGSCLGCANQGVPYTRGLTNAARLRSAGFDIELNVRNKSCCVIGSWCGYEALLLHGYGAARVDCIEEVQEYALMSEIQLNAFGIYNRIMSTSLYDMNHFDLQQQYDFVYVPGVLYHCSDPTCALFIIRLLTKPGGTVLFETMSTPGNITAQYLGPQRMGWNWWMATHLTWVRMMEDAGFEGVQHIESAGARAWFGGIASKKIPLVESGAAGFSRKDLISLI